MKIKIFFLKIFDMLAGNTLAFLLPLFRAKKENSAANINRVLFIRPGGLGDFILLIPAINLLRSHFPEAKIDILCEKRNRAAADFLTGINDIFLYDTLSELDKCIKTDYDVIIDTEQWHRLSAVSAFISGAPVIIGFGTNNRKRLLTHSVPYSHDEYEMLSFVRLLQPLGIDVPRDLPDENFIFPDLSSINNIEDNIVTIAPGATVKERIWDASKYAKVSKKLIDKGYKVFLLGGSDDCLIADKISALEPRCVNMSGKIDLAASAAYIKKSKVFISPDSGLMHLAFAMGVPTISLFGSGIEKKWGPKGPNHIIINKKLSCSPCTRFGYTKPCGNNIACLKQITVGDLSEALRSIL